MTIHRLMYWLFLAVGMILFATVGSWSQTRF
jgi:hypothetical protein